jgi:hypothetical protein
MLPKPKIIVIVRALMQALVMVVFMPELLPVQTGISTRTLLNFLCEKLWTLLPEIIIGTKFVDLNMRKRLPAESLSRFAGAFYFDP